MYHNLQWKDHAVTPDRTYNMAQNPDRTVTLTPAGKVIQQGTNMSAANFNNIEMGITDQDLAAHITLLLVHDLRCRADVSEADIKVEEKTMTLTNTAKYPFNNSIASVSMEQARKTKNYTVEAEVTAANGNVGEIVVSDKTLNGFKIAFTGSAKSVTVAIKIKGGIIV